MTHVHDWVGVCKGKKPLSISTWCPPVPLFPTPGKCQAVRGHVLSVRAVRKSRQTRRAITNIHRVSLLSLHPDSSFTVLLIIPTLPCTSLPTRLVYFSSRSVGGLLPHTLVFGVMLIWQRLRKQRCSGMFVCSQKISDPQRNYKPRFRRFLGTRMLEIRIYLFFPQHLCSGRAGGDDWCCKHFCLSQWVWPHEVSLFREFQIVYMDAHTY